MTKALDAAVRAYCEYDEQVTDCPYPKCKCDWQGNAILVALRAALPEQPTQEMIDTMAPYFYDENWKNFGALYRAVRRAVLGEDA